MGRTLEWTLGPSRGHRGRVALLGRFVDFRGTINLGPTLGSDPESLLGDVVLLETLTVTEPRHT